ncbi:hypothetical protein HDU78_002054 [Chytriomyces hyalinus]|nr:hypothetical protein HDU78_002054 [Chytriomyces hyalinus]
MKWADYTNISPQTRHAITETLKFPEMTLVQDAVMSLMFGATSTTPPTSASTTDPVAEAQQQPEALPTPQKFHFESLNLPVTKGLPLTEKEARKSSSRIPETLKIGDFLNSLPSKSLVPVDAQSETVARGRTRKPFEPTQTDVGNRLHAPDLLVRSKTGTGKTLAFIVAAVESVLKSPGGFNRTAVTPILVIAPSRELAHQIYEEAKVIIRAHRLNAISLVGGDDRAKQRKKIVYDPVQLIVATPGRLLDLLQYEPKLKSRLRGVKVLIYDEADLLLEYGFSVAMERILKYLPPREERQTFMFSATISEEIKLLATETMRPSQTISIDTVALNQTPTHLTTKQTHIQCPYSLQPQLLLHLLKHHIATTPQSKIIVFFPTTHLTAHLAQVFNNVSNLDVLQIHSQIDQRERMRVSDRFRASRGSSILFTSDVSARGVDYPDVTLVLQMGLPRNLEQYIHRVGRTGRAGKPGQAIIVHTRYETPFIEKVLLGNGGLPIKRDLVHNPQVIARDKAALQTLKDAYRKGDWSVGSACYAAFLGYYRGFGSEVMTLPNETLVKAAEEFALGLCGLPMVPKVGSGLLTRLRLRVDDGVKVLKPGEDPDTLPNTESTPPLSRRTSPTPSKVRSRR